MNKHLGAKKRPAKPVRSTGARKASPRKARARVTAKKHEPRNGRKVAVRSVAPANLPKVSPGVIGSAGASIGASTSISASTGINGSISVNQVRLTRASTSQLSIRSMNVSAVAAIGEALQSHKFQVGQAVSYTSSPISRPGASGSYKVVRLLPSDGEDYQYRIKHAGEAFERVAKESQLEIDG